MPQHRRKFIPTYYHLGAAILAVALVAMASLFVPRRKAEKPRGAHQFEFVARTGRQVSVAEVKSNAVSLSFIPPMPRDDVNIYLATQEAVNELLDVRVVLDTRSARPVTNAPPDSTHALPALRYTVGDMQGAYAAVGMESEAGIQRLFIWVGP